MWVLACLSLKMSIELFLFPFLFSTYFCFVDQPGVCIVSGVCNQSSFVFFILCPSLHAELSTLSSMLAILLPPSFLDTYKRCQRYICDVRPYILSWVFLFSGPFVKVLPASTQRMVPSILQMGHPWLHEVSYIYNNLLSTSIHGYQEKEKNTPEFRDNNIPNHCLG